MSATLEAVERYDLIYSYCLERFERAQRRGSRRWAMRWESRMQLAERRRQDVIDDGHAEDKEREESAYWDHVNARIDAARELRRSWR